MAFYDWLGVTYCCFKIVEIIPTCIAIAEVCFLLLPKPKVLVYLVQTNSKAAVLVYAIKFSEIHAYVPQDASKLLLNLLANKLTTWMSHD